MVLTADVSSEHAQPVYYTRVGSASDARWSKKAENEDIHTHRHIK